MLKSLFGSLFGKSAAPKVRSPQPKRTWKPQPGQTSADYFDLAKKLYKAGNVAVALDMFENVLSYLPNQADVEFHTGSALADLGYDSEAIPLVERAVKNDRYMRAEYTYLLGVLLTRNGRAEEADKHFAHAAMYGHQGARDLLASKGLEFCHCGATRKLGYDGVCPHDSEETAP